MIKVVHLSCVLIGATGMLPAVAGDTLRESMTFRYAQNSGSSTAAGGSVKIEENPDPTNLVAEKKPPETNWKAKCVNDEQGASVDCRVVQNIQLTKTKQRLLSVMVRMPTLTRQPALAFNLPHGLYLPAGTTIQIDRSEPFALEIETCDQKGCYANMPAGNELLTALKRGANLTVTFQNLARKPIAVPVTLVGFTAAFDKIR